MLGSYGGGSASIQPSYDPILQAEKELRDQRLKLLQETIAEERKLREEAIGKLRDSFDEEYEVLRDLWDRNIISTDVFKTQSGNLRQSRDEAIDEANQPTEAEQQAAQQEKEKTDMAALRQVLYARFDNGLRIVDAISTNNYIDQGFKAAYRQGLVTYGNQIPTIETLKELQDISTYFDNLSAAVTKSFKVPAFGLGGDFTTSGPQLIMVGDNPGGRERVSVEPISSPNIHGPSGDGGVTINVNGDVYGIEDLYARLAAAGRVLERRGRARAYA